MYVNFRRHWGTKDGTLGSVFSHFSPLLDHSLQNLLPPPSHTVFFDNVIATFPVYDTELDFDHCHSHYQKYSLCQLGHQVSYGCCKLDTRALKDDFSHGLNLSESKVLGWHKL